MKDVNIRIVASCDTSNLERKGYYILEMQYKNVVQYSRGIDTHTTVNKMIINAVINSIRKLKEPCNIKLYTTTPIGLSYINKNKIRKSVNKIELEELNNVLILGEHKIENIVTMNHVKRLKSVK